MTGRQAWTRRLTIASYALHLFALVTAVVASAIPGGFDATTLAAAIVASVGTSATFMARLPFPERSTREAVVLAVAITCFSIATALTGGFTSTYTLMPIATIFLAAIGGGMTAAMPTAAIAIIGVAIGQIIGNPDDDLTGSLIRVPAFYLLTAIAFSEVRRAVIEQDLSTDARLAADASGNRRANLEATHELLQDLVRVASSPDINAVAAAQDAIRDAAVIHPFSSGRILSGTGLVLARRGGERSDTPVAVLETNGAGSGTRLEVWDPEWDPSEAQTDALIDAIRPVDLALDNDAMVSTVAGVAVQRERVRLARELHDDIAPNVASVGLTLDMLVASGQLDDEQTRNIVATRENVSHLVERIRRQVQDLRADRSRSLTNYVHALVAEVDADGPTVTITIDERTPPRPAVAQEVRAMMTEAFRNAVNHADATVIAIDGKTDEDGGWVSIGDNGVGFDPSIEPDRRFGLVGMHERSRLIGAEVSVASGPGDGTLVRIEWSYNA